MKEALQGGLVERLWKGERTQKVLCKAESKDQSGGGFREKRIEMHPCACWTTTAAAGPEETRCGRSTASKKCGGIRK